MNKSLHCIYYGERRWKETTGDRSPACTEEMSPPPGCLLMFNIRILPLGRRGQISPHQPALNQKRQRPPNILETLNNLLSFPLPWARILKEHKWYKYVSTVISAALMKGALQVWRHKHPSWELHHGGEKAEAIQGTGFIESAQTRRGMARHGPGGDLQLPAELVNRAASSERANLKGKLSFSSCPDIFPWKGMNCSEDECEMVYCRDKIIL